MYPTHLIIGLTTTAIFIVILFAKHTFDVATKGKVQPSLDYISLAGGILALVVFIGSPYSQQSLLDYRVNLPNDTSISVDVLNTGIKEAENVLLSFNSKNIKFSNFTTQPYLPFKSVTADNTIQSGNANFTLDILPSRSFTTVYTKVNASDRTDELKVYVRSDDSVAYFNLGLIIVYYIILAIVYAISAYFFWQYPKPIEDNNGRHRNVNNGFRERKIIVASSMFILFLVHLMIPLLHDCGFVSGICGR